jgi:hypothetical protein
VQFIPVQWIEFIFLSKSHTNCLNFNKIRRRKKKKKKKRVEFYLGFASLNWKIQLAFTEYLRKSQTTSSIKKEPN